MASATADPPAAAPARTNRPEPQATSRPHRASDPAADSPTPPASNAPPASSRAAESVRRDLQTLKAGLRLASRPSLLELPRVFQTEEEHQEHLQILRELRERDESDGGLEDDGGPEEGEEPDPGVLAEHLAWVERRREIAEEARRMRLSSR